MAGRARHLVEKSGHDINLLDSSLVYYLIINYLVRLSFILLITQNLM